VSGPFLSFQANTSDPDATVTHLDYRDSPNNPTRLELINASKKKLDLYTLAAQEVGSWNLCYLRPGAYSNYFKEHKCDELTLDFENEQDVTQFKIDLMRLRSSALGFSLDSPPRSRRSSSSGAAIPGAQPVVLPTHSPGLGHDIPPRVSEASSMSSVSSVSRFSRFSRVSRVSEASSVSRGYTVNSRMDAG
jgi:hypothetical protein